MTNAANTTFPMQSLVHPHPVTAWLSRSPKRQPLLRFLTLVNSFTLTALIVGGVGVANAVHAFIDSKRTTITSLKCLGVPVSVVTP